MHYSRFTNSRGLCFCVCVHIQRILPLSPLRYTPLASCRQTSSFRPVVTPTPPHMENTWKKYYIRLEHMLCIYSSMVYGTTWSQRRWKRESFMRPATMNLTSISVNCATGTLLLLSLLLLLLLCVGIVAFFFYFACEVAI